MSVYTQHPFIPGEQRPSSAGWYHLCATCKGTEEAVFSDHSRVHPRHTAVPSEGRGPLTCQVCGGAVRQWPDGRFPIHASVTLEGGWAGPWPEDEQENTGAEA